MSKATSKAETTKAIKELSFLTKLPEKKIRSLLWEYTMTEIRNGRFVWSDWVPLEEDSEDRSDSRTDTRTGSEAREVPLPARLGQTQAIRTVGLAVPPGEIRV